jgi:hypothetical protein
MLVAAGATSCSKMLEQYSHTAIQPESISVSDLPAVRMGMYNSVEEDPGTLSYLIFDIVGGDVNQKTYNPIDVINSELKTGSTMSAEWKGYYSALYQVNNVINIAGRFPDNPTSQIMLAEAYYFRAWLYLCLNTRFRGVPVLTSNTEDYIPRSTEEKTWQFIDENIDKALSLLGNSTSYYYVSLDAAKALKARICLYEGKNEEAARYADELITCGRYALDDFEDIFGTYPQPKTNTETIFAFRCDMETSSIRLGNEFYSYDYVNKGKGTYSVTEDIWKLYESTDKRRNTSILLDGGYYRLNKYPSGQAGTDPVIISRIGEMYLISAEAKGYPAGVARLNELRTARGLDSAPVTNSGNFLDAILKERRLELLGENQMYYDYVRTGTAVKYLGIKEFQTRFPIPDSERTLSRGTLEQNEGY